MKRQIEHPKHHGVPRFPALSLEHLVVTASVIIPPSK